MATETLRPNAAGDETNLDGQYPDSGAHWDKVDEATSDEGSTFLYVYAATYKRDLFNLPASSIPDGSTINFIKIYFRGQRNAETEAYAKPSLKSNTTVTDGTEVVLPNQPPDGPGWTTFSEQWNTNPADGQAWEKSDINALQIGVSLKGSQVDSSAAVTQVYVEVDYTAGVTEKTSSDSGPGADAVDSLQTPQAKTSSDTGSGIEALFTRLLAAVDAGSGVEASSVETDGLFKDLFATEVGEGSDCLTAKIEMPTKGGGMKLWT